MNNTFYTIDLLLLLQFLKGFALIGIQRNI